MLETKTDSLLALVASIAFVLLVIYLFSQDAALVGPL